jgi:hypothetical protein
MNLLHVHIAIRQYNKWATFIFFQPAPLSLVRIYFLVDSGNGFHPRPFLLPLSPSCERHYCVTYSIVIQTSDYILQ